MRTSFSKSDAYRKWIAACCLLATGALAIGGCPGGNPGGGPTISNASATGSLTQGQAGTITVSCDVSVASGSVQSVVADLSQVGGDAAQALTESSGTWSWSGSVTPPNSGTQTVTFTATDSAGKSSTATATIDVSSGGQGGGSLTGTFKGDVAYAISTTLGGSVFSTTNQTQSTTITFDAAGKPDKTIIPLIEAPLTVAEVPLTDLNNVGDTTDVAVTESGQQETLTVTVSSVSSTSTQYKLTLAVSYLSATGPPPFEGPHNLTATLQNDGTVLWTSDTNIVSGTGALAIGTSSTSTGTLTRQ